MLKTKYLSIALLTTMLIFPALAQSTPVTLVMQEVENIGRLSWASDNSQFFVRSRLSTESPTEWHSFNLSENVVTHLTTSPFQSVFSSQETESLQARRNLEVNNRYVSESPNREWFVAGTLPVSSVDSSNEFNSVPTDDDRDTVTNITLLHRSTEQIIQIPTTLPARGFASFHWSDDSTSFVMAVTPPASAAPARFFYITGYSDFPSTQLIVEDILNVATTSEAYVTNQIYDLSRDGDQVLLFGIYRNPTTGRETRELLLWNASTHIASILEGIDARSVTAAAFAPNSNTRIRAVTETGLIEYDTTTGTSTLLREDVNSIRFNSIFSQFSPDGQYLALVGRSESRQFLSSVYVVAVP